MCGGVEGGSEMVQICVTAFMIKVLQNLGPTPTKNCFGALGIIHKWCHATSRGRVLLWNYVWRPKKKNNFLCDGVEGGSEIVQICVTALVIKVLHNLGTTPNKKFALSKAIEETKTEKLEMYFDWKLHKYLTFLIIGSPEKDR